MGMAGYNMPANGNGKAVLPNAHNVSPESQKSPESLTMTGTPTSFLSMPQPSTHCSIKPCMKQADWCHICRIIIGSAACDNVFHTVYCKEEMLCTVCLTEGVCVQAWGGWCVERARP